MSPNGGVKFVVFQDFNVKFLSFFWISVRNTVALVGNRPDTQ